MGKLKIVVVAFERVIPLRILTDCFLIQTDPNWEMHIIHDGPAPQEVKNIIPPDPRVIFYESSKRLKNYGHPNRRHMLQTIPVDPSDYILITNDDNYYVPEYVNYMRRAATSGVGIVYHDCIHNYYSYAVLPAEMKTNHIDMGSFIVRADVARKVGFTSDAFHADGIYAEACAAYCKQNNLRIEYIPRPLFTHN